MSNTWEPWSYRESVARTPEAGGIVGYKVEATDGHIGKIDEASDAVGDANIVVDTGPWIFGRKVILPAGTIERIDDADEKVYVDLTKEQIKNSPELSEDAKLSDSDYRESVAVYYGGYYI
ncbi:PRC-barrel domain containing protein [Microterricola pindariensis]|uniref:PRC domain containing protein n=1 Tax=Microterricola pindariensis TaxID=478010 RepID=A0ABX5B0C7_9MICO|nr:PRC-barrel domain containing protein [Microterricola pindariensis]PPL20249.1 PRC domain containing protein [Microterricola pindariensis]